MQQQNVLSKHDLEEKTIRYQNKFLRVLWLVLASLGFLALEAVGLISVDNHPAFGYTMCFVGGIGIALLVWCFNSSDEN